MTNDRKSHAREIFMEIIDLPEDERQAKLDELCKDDSLLKLDVEVLLMAHDDADGFMDSPTASIHSAPITEKAGTIIGPYKLLQEIGQGGFGTVFLADQSKPIRRRVALKIIKLGMDTKQVIARFEAERQALALMDHPNIARVLDAGATETGRPYFVMEYVVGDSITEFADAHKLSVKDRLELFNQACTAVQHAHTKGIIHRDIKPSNILVNMTDGKPFAKVIDFGIAKATAAPLTEKTLFTEHHQLIGTLEYMSPEQAEGLPDIDTRTDVYALGVLLYELLTGHTPIDGKRLRSAAWHEMRRIIKEEEPPAPSMRLSRNIYALAQVATARQTEPGKLSATLKGELDWIAIKALDKDRTRRYETPSALAADVQRHLDGDAVIAAPPSRAYKVRKFVRRNKGMVISGSAVAAALLVGIAGTSLGLLRAELANSAKDVAIQSELKAKDTAQWDSYTANLALAQMAMDNGNWPEARTRLAACPESKRGWEWEYFDRLASSTILNHFPSPFTRPRFMPDGQSLLINSYTNTPVIQDLRLSNAGRKMQDLQGLDSGVLASRFSNDGKYLSAWGIQESRVVIWRVDQSGKYIPHRRIEWEGRNAYDAYFDPTGERVIIPIYSSGENVLLWDIDSNQQIAAFEASTNWAAFSPDGRYIVSPRDDGVCIFDASGKTTEPLVVLPGERCDATNDVFSSDGRMLVTRSKNNAATIWDLHPDRLGEKIAVLAGHTDILRTAEFNPDGSMVVTISHDKTAKLWDATNEHIGELLASLKGHGKWAASVDFSADGRFVATGSADGILRVWDADRSSETFGSQIWSVNVGGYVDNIEFNSAISDENILLMADGNTFNDSGEPTNGTGLSIFQVSQMGGFGANFVSSRYDPIQLQLDVIFGERVITIPEYRAYERLPQNERLEVVTADGSRRIIVSSDRSIQFLDSSTEKLLATIRTDRDIIDMNMTSDGSRLVLLEHQPGRGLYIEVLDIRAPEERRADVQRRWAERVPAGAYLDTLMAGPTPTADLMATIEADDSLTPLRRLAAAEVLQERLADIKSQADRAFAEITKDQTDQATVLAAAEAIDLPPRVKELVLAKAEAWEYVPPRVSDKERLAEAKETIQRTKSSLIAEGDAWLADIDFGPGGGYVKANAASRYLAAARAFEEALGADHPKTLEAKTWGAISRLNDIPFITNDELQEVEKSIDLYSQVGETSVIEKMIYSVSNALIPQYRDSMKWLGKLPNTDQDRKMLRWTHKSLSAREILSRLIEGEIAQNSDQSRLQNIQLDTQSMVSSTTFSFFDAAAFQAHALVLYRLKKYSDALNSAIAAAGLRKDIDGTFPVDSQERIQNPIEQAILAMAHFQLAQGLPESDPTREEHLAEANKALAQCQAIMADPSALNDAGQPWAEDRIAQSLLAEAEALIGGEGGDDE